MSTQHNQTNEWADLDAAEMGEVHGGEGAWTRAGHVAGATMGAVANGVETVAEVACGMAESVYLWLS